VALYEYRCPEGHFTEVFHRMGEAPEVRCEVCGAAAERVISSPNIHTQYYFSPHIKGAKKPGRRSSGKASAKDTAAGS
jgi:putative FmdB family regulatory protein